MRELDLSAIRARLANKSGPTYWRSLEELAETEAFTDFLHREFPVQASEFTDPAGRRGFLKLMGASLALAGAAGCTRQPEELIVPYVKQPEEIIPGKPLYFATAMPHGGFATPILVESHMGRPTKVEPNKEHPATRGGTDVFAQASILTLYDPDRSRTITYRGEIRPWTEFATVMQGALNSQKAFQGAGLRLLTETVTSPTLASQIDGLLKTYPAAKWVQYDAVSRDEVRAGARAALGRDVETRYHLDKAQVVVSLDANLFEQDPGRLRYQRDFADRRRLTDGQAKANRMYAIESRVSNTGSVADHRVAVRAADVDAVARAIAAGVGVAGVSAGSLPKQVKDTWVAALVKDLHAHHGSSLIIVGEHQPASVHHLAHLINAALHNVGQTLEYTDPVEAKPIDQTAALKELTGEMAAGKVDLLIILSANPVFTAPADLKFGEALSKVNTRVHLGLFQDETAAECDWHIPESYYLESWGDSRAFDGTVTIQQPLIAPLYESKSAHEVLDALAGAPSRTDAESVRGFWESQYNSKTGAFGPFNDPDGQAFASFDKFWRRALHDGFIAGSALAAVSVEPTGAAPAAAPAPGPDAIEITFSPDATVYDGRFANNGWMQETPKPFNKLTWDNAALVSPSTAERLGVATQDVIEVRANGAAVRAPVWVMPGQPESSINLQLGYGRVRAGSVGNGIGYNPYVVRTSSQPWTLTGAEVVKTGDAYELASTQGHFNMEGRQLVRTGTLGEYEHEPAFAKHLGHRPSPDVTLHGNEWKYEGYAWGMVIDLNVCNGCNACVVACTSENNIPVVGKTQVLRSREMQWIRIDRYYEGDPDSPAIYNQPILCMQCENAPCEVVCPVAATSHSSEGLNDMVYNRCVGTRYCSNNCPYKVRRFNFLLYSDWTTPTLKMARNPDVTVRSRGVMEKCTYCVQRINTARIQSKLEDRRIRDGEVETACQTACPTQAIVFGDLNDPQSRVAKLKKEPREYGLLEDLNTRPRTTYLAVVRNPNTEITPAAAGHGETSESPAAAPHE